MLNANYALFCIQIKQLIIIITLDITYVTCAAENNFYVIIGIYIKH